MQAIEDIPKYLVNEAEHKERMAKVERASRDLANSIEKELLTIETTPRSLNFLYVGQMILCSAVLEASKFKEEPFGPVGNLAESGGLAFASKILTDYYADRFFGFSSPTIFGVCDTIVDKGYRIWKFENVDQNFNLPSLENIDEIKSTLSKIDEKFQKCESIDEIKEKAGDVVGVGGHTFFLDYLISAVQKSINPKIEKKPFEETRLHSLNAIKRNLANGWIVPVRVRKTGENSGHYVVITAIRGGSVYYADSSKGDIFICDIKEFLEWMIQDKSHVAAFNVKITK